jgi:hypothetical protein
MAKLLDTSMSEARPPLFECQLQSLHPLLLGNHLLAATKGSGPTRSEGEGATRKGSEHDLPFDLVPFDAEQRSRRRELRLASLRLTPTACPR